MRTRPITALLAAVALLVITPAASHAQTPTPTAAAAQSDGTAAKPPDGASKEVKAIYTDYSRDGLISPCKHSADDLQETLDTIEPDFDRDFPDFREAIEANIERDDNGKCDDAEATATPTPTATASPEATEDPLPSPESGALPTPDDGSSSGDDGGGALPPATEDGTLPPDDGTLPPAADDGTTIAPPAATPAPTVPPVAAATPAPAPTPMIVSSSNTDGLLIPGILVGIAVLGAGLLAVSALSSRGNPRTRHAWSEAAYRTKSTWADFSDWLKIGR